MYLYNIAYAPTFEHLIELRENIKMLNVSEKDCEWFLCFYTFIVLFSQ